MLFINKKGRAYWKFILQQLGRLDLLRPVAFRPLLAKSLALSGRPASHKKTNMIQKRILI